MSKSDYDKAMFRLTTIVMRMNVGKRAHPRDLAEEFGVSVRTIQKDLNERLSEWPVIRHDDGSYGFSAGFHIKGTPKVEESAVQELMVAMVEQVSPQFGEIAREMSNGCLTNRTLAIHLNIEPLNEHTETFHILRQAITIRQQIGFLYTESSGERREVKANPMFIECREGKWFVCGQEHGHDSDKQWRLVHMDRIHLYPRSFA